MKHIKKYKKELLIVLAVLIVGGFWYFGQNELSSKRPPRDGYPYFCKPDGSVLVTPSVGMNTLLIEPIGGTKFPSGRVVVYRALAAAGVEIDKNHYEGDGIVVVGEGERVTISSQKSSITCAPMPYNEFPSLKFEE